MRVYANTIDKCVDSESVTMLTSRKFDFIGVFTQRAGMYHVARF
jgi:hypothetical protein